MTNTADQPTKEKLDDAGLNRFLLEAFINGDPPEDIVSELKKHGIETTERRATKAMKKLGKWFNWTVKKIGA